MLFCALSPGVPAAETKWRLSVSGELPVKVVYADRNAEISRQVEVKTAARKKETDCRGGSLVGAMNCVSEKIEAAGSGEKGTEEKKYRTITEKADLRAELSGAVVPVIEVVEEGRRYRVRLDTSKMNHATELSGPFDRERKNRLVRDEIKLKKSLKAWSEEIGPDELEEMSRSEDHSMEFSFAEAFDGLMLMNNRLRPREPKVVVYYTSGDCFDLNVKFIKAQSEYLELEASIPFAQQFEVVTRTMTEVEDVFASTAKDIKEVKGQFGKVLDKSPLEAKIEEYMENADGLSETLKTSLEGFRDIIKEEREAILEAGKTFAKPAKEIQKALGSTEKSMKKVSAAAKKINGYLEIGKTIVEAENMSGPDQLKAMGKTFRLVVDKLGPLLEDIPVIGVFLDLYAQAIEQIAVSAEKIESVVLERNRTAALLRATGDPWFPDPYKVLNTAEERLKKERSELFGRVEKLKDRLLEECSMEVPWKEEYGYFGEIEDAGEIAEEACRDLKIDYRERQRLESELKKAYGEYAGAERALIKGGIRDEEQAARLRKLQKTEEGLGGYLMRNPRPGSRERRRMLRSLETIKTLRGGTLTKAETSIWVDLKSARGQKPAALDPDDILAMRDENKKLKKNLGAWKERQQALDDARARIDEAKAAMDSLRENNRAYKDCKKDYLRRLADEKGWDMKAVELANFDLFSGE